MAGFDQFQPGELNRIISIYLPGATTQDDDGFETKGAETLILKCHAKVTDESGTAALQSGSEFSVSRRRFLIRWVNTEINTDMFVRYKPRGSSVTKDFKIVRPPNPYGDAGRFMEIWTELREMV